MPGKYFKKKGQSNSFKISNPYGPPLKHFVDDNPEHQDTYGDHSDDLQTEGEHLANKNVTMQEEKRAKKEGTRTHWPDGTKRTKREMFEYDETKTEEGKDTPLEQLDPNMMSEQGVGGSLGGGMSAVPPVDPNAQMGGGMFYKKKKKK
jgi:hypothetical protein|tara:strand:- start:86 stop:529 length:444 start_codon:yes stop_codon:yes gene_type:complete